MLPAALSVTWRADQFGVSKTILIFFYS